MFDFVFVILSVAGLLGLLAYAALHEDGDKRQVRLQANTSRQPK